MQLHKISPSGFLDKLVSTIKTLTAPAKAFTAPWGGICTICQKNLVTTNDANMMFLPCKCYAVDLKCYLSFIRGRTWKKAGFCPMCGINSTEIFLKVGDNERDVRVEIAQILAGWAEERGGET